MTVEPCCRKSTAVIMPLCACSPFYSLSKYPTKQLGPVRIFKLFFRPITGKDGVINQLCYSLIDRWPAMWVNKKSRQWDVSNTDRTLIAVCALTTWSGFGKSLKHIILHLQKSNYNWYTLWQIELRMGYSSSKSRCRLEEINTK